MKRISTTVGTLILLIIAAAVAVLFYMFIGDTPQPASPIEKTGYLYVGLVAPSSGPAVEYGRAMIRGAEMAAEDFNASHRDGQRPVKLIFENEAALESGSPQLVRDNRVAMVVGHLTERSLAAVRDEYLTFGRRCFCP